MFVPLHDDSVLRVIRFQFMCGAIALVNVVSLFYVQHVLGPQEGEIVLISFGATPALLTDRAYLDPSLLAVPEPLTLITYMFLHGGWLHLLANMLFLWVFGDNVEDAYGHFGFLIFFLICGIAAALTHTLFYPSSQAPLVGASGAVAGVLGSYLVLYPHARVWVLLLMRLPIRISAYWALLGWIGFQFVALVLPQDDNIQVAWWAHIGGFAMGFGLTWMLRDRLRERLARDPQVSVPGRR